MEQIRRCEWAGPDQIYIDYHDQAVGMADDHMAWCPWHTNRWTSQTKD